MMIEFFLFSWFEGWFEEFENSTATTRKKNCMSSKQLTPKIIILVNARYREKKKRFLRNNKSPTKYFMPFEVKREKKRKRINFPLDLTLNGLNGFLTKILPHFNGSNLNRVHTHNWTKNHFHPDYLKLHNRTV